MGVLDCLVHMHSSRPHLGRDRGVWVGNLWGLEFKLEEEEFDFFMATQANVSTAIVDI